MRAALCAAIGLGLGLLGTSSASAANVVAELNGDVLTITGSTSIDNVVIVQFIGRTMVVGSGGTKVNNQTQAVFMDDVNHIDVNLDAGNDVFAVAFGSFSSLDVDTGAGKNSLGLINARIGTSSYKGSGQDTALVIGGRLTHITSSTGFRFVFPQGALNPR